MPELIIFVGMQAAGKSTYYRAQLAATHVHVSKDLMPITSKKLVLPSFDEGFDEVRVIKPPPDAA